MEIFFEEYFKELEREKINKEIVNGTPKHRPVDDPRKQNNERLG